eukprot:7060719-Prymnesium_polylepis.1
MTRAGITVKALRRRLPVPAVVAPGASAIPFHASAISRGASALAPAATAAATDASAGASGAGPSPSEAPGAGGALATLRPSVP